MRKVSLWPLYLTVFIDLVGFSIVLPILPELFLNPSYGLLPADAPLVLKTQMVGLMLGLYPLLQIFSAPIMGSLADRYGRKPIIILSLIGTFIGHVLFGFGILSHSLLLLFIGRIIPAITSGNISVAMSAIADVSSEKDRAKNFGLVGLAFGLGFIIGPALGGRLTDPNLVSWFASDTPFWFAAALTLANIIWLLFSFRETLAVCKKTPVTLLTGLKQIAVAFTLPRIRTIFLVTFLLTLGFNFFIQFFQVYLSGQFHATPSQIGDLFGFAGICVAITQGLLIRLIAKRWGAERILSVVQIGAAIALLLVLLPRNLPEIYLVIPFIALFNGLAVPNLNSIVSAQADAASQGEIFGMNQSVVSLAQALPPVLAGFVAGIDTRLPILVGVVLTLFAWAVFQFGFLKEHGRKVSL